MLIKKGGIYRQIKADKLPQEYAEKGYEPAEAKKEPKADKPEAKKEPKD